MAVAIAFLLPVFFDFMLVRPITSGIWDLPGWSGTRIAFLCDVDSVYAKRTYDRFPKARVYRDYREMLDAENMKFANNDKANEHVTPNYRSGWSL